MKQEFFHSIQDLFVKPKALTRLRFFDANFRGRSDACCASGPKSETIAIVDTRIREMSAQKYLPNVTGFTVGLAGRWLTLSIH